MNLDDEKERVPVPKWRALFQTPSSELVSARGFKPDKQIALNRSNRARSLYERWRASPSLDNALEVLDCSIFIEDISLFFGPATQILDSPEATRTSKMIAEHVIRSRANPRVVSEDLASFDLVRGTIRHNKKRLLDEYRNSLLHAEQARLYTMVGELKAAERSFSIALAVSPDNRHILRSYARFMVHIGGPELALKRLRASAGIRSDPWLQAAEIAISEHTNAPSRTARAATKNIEAGHVKPEHISELAVCLATLELKSGHRKRFKKRLNESLKKPTDNALAQMMWFARKSPADLNEEELINPRLRFLLGKSQEALAYNFLNEKKWQDAARSFLKWQQEESFSCHIAMQGSFYAVSLANDYDTAIKICRNGLEANRQAPSLLNNLCVAQRRAGLIVDAERTMQILKSSDTSWFKNPIFLATDGMLLFANGKLIDARHHYAQAFSMALENDDIALQERIKMHWLYEEASGAGISISQADSLIHKLEHSPSFESLSPEIKDSWHIMKALIRDDAEKKNVGENLPEELMKSIGLDS